MGIDEVARRHQVYADAVERLATDPAALPDCRDAARAWADVVVDVDVCPRPAPEDVL